VAKFIDADHHELLLDDVEPDLLAKVVAHLEEPIGDPAALLLFQLAKLTRRHVTVALTGEGSDETNLGYSKAAAFARWAELRKTPVIGRILEAIWLRRWTRGGRSGSRLGITLEDLYAELSWPGLPRATLKNADSYGAWSEGLRRVLSACPSDDQLSRLLYLDLKCWMADDLLLKVDKTTMAHGLEARVPFLDHALVEWNMRIPPVWKLGSTGNKLFLRELMKDRLSAATVSRPQHGFLAPLANWFSGDWSTYLDRMLGEHGLARREVIPAAYLSSVRRGLAAGEQQFLLPAFMLAALECWIQEFRVTT
jgi:asparagine synthase (glutamine-hydrolysing)